MEKGEAEVAGPLKVGALGFVCFIETLFDKADANDANLVAVAVGFHELHVLMKGSMVEDFANVAIAVFHFQKGSDGFHQAWLAFAQDFKGLLFRGFLSQDLAEDFFRVVGDIGEKDGPGVILFEISRDFQGAGIPLDCWNDLVIEGKNGPIFR